MYNQFPKIGRIDLSRSFDDPPDDFNASQTGKPPLPPPYQVYPQYPNPGYPPPGSYPNYIFPAQQYGAPGGPRGPFDQGPHPGQTVFTVQPTGVAATTPLASAVPDYMGYSIFTMLFCCLPLGIAAVVFSCNTQDAKRTGELERARKNSRTSLIINNVTLGIGLTVYIVMIILTFTVLQN